VQHLNPQVICTDDFTIHALAARRSADCGFSFAAGL
jgi:hypothetical protein